MSRATLLHVTKTITYHPTGNCIFWNSGGLTGLAVARRKSKFNQKYVNAIWPDPLFLITDSPNIPVPDTNEDIVYLYTVYFVAGQITTIVTQRFLWVF